jgi:muramoyltetrapeptide carboxypeptidase
MLRFDYPRRPLGDDRLIEVVSPAGWLTDERLDAVQGRLLAQGLRVRIAPESSSRSGALAGSDEERRRAFARALADERVGVLLCACGGYGSPRIADQIPLAGEGKLLIGYSDTSDLLLKFSRGGGALALHGPMAVDFADPEKKAAIEGLIGFLKGEDSGPRALGDLNRDLRVLRPGRAFGRLVASNLTLLETALGTSSWPDLSGAILLVEDVGEALYAVDRTFTHLKRAGALEHLSALCLGDFTQMEQGRTPFGKSVEEIALEVTASLGIPVVAGFPVGHGARNVIVPLGVAAALEASPR